jgi:hypothetical protein
MVIFLLPQWGVVGVIYIAAEKTIANYDHATAISKF